MPAISWILVQVPLSNCPSKRLISLVTQGLHKKFYYIAMFVHSQSVRTSIAEEKPKYVKYDEFKIYSLC